MRRRCRVGFNEGMNKKTDQSSCRDAIAGRVMQRTTIGQVHLRSRRFLLSSNRNRSDMQHWDRRESGGRGYPAAQLLEFTERWSILTLSPHFRRRALRGCSSSSPSSLDVWGQGRVRVSLVSVRSSRRSWAGRTPVRP